MSNCFDLQIKTMIANLKKAFKSLVDDATWMDSDTKSKAKDKVDAMTEFIGYPQWIKNKTAVEDYYNGVMKHCTLDHLTGLVITTNKTNSIHRFPKHRLVAISATFNKHIL